MGLLDGLLTGSASKLVDSVGNAIDKLVTSDEERQALKNELAKEARRHEEKMTALEIEKEKVILGDLDSARQNQSRVQESAHAGWLAKNIQPFLALVICVLAFAIFGKVLFAGPETQTEHGIAMMILGGLLSHVGQILSYFFGASTESNNLKDKIKSKIKKAI
jgi:hypothetical protein